MVGWLCASGEVPVGPQLCGKGCHHVELPTQWLVV